MSFRSMFTEGRVSRHIPAANTKGSSIQERPTWEPPKAAPVRPGAEDAASLPSLQNGNRVAAKKPTAMTSSVQDFAFQKAPRNPKKGKK